MKAFDNYVNNFDLENKKINRKYNHSYRVRDTSVYIATKLGLKTKDIELAKFIGLIHDIGRFEQIKRYDSFNDSNTIDHADYGVELLFKENLIELFVMDKTYYPLIEASVRNHNKYFIDKEYDDETMLHIKIIRDSDKIDILNIFSNNIDNNVFEDDGDISLEVKKEFLNNKLVHNNIKVSKSDWIVGYLSFIYDINFKESLEYIVEQDFVNKLYERINDKEKFKDVFEHLQKYILKEIEKC